MPEVKDSSVKNQNLIEERLTRSQRKDLTVLVLGCYSVIGIDIIKGLLEKTKMGIIAAGRNPNKMSKLIREVNSDRIRLEIVDVFNTDDVKKLCMQSDIVINCVGPYALSGFQIAKICAENGKHYIDFAYEQVEYNRLKTLGEVARNNQCVCVTGAGMLTGVSTLVVKYLLDKLPTAESARIEALDGGRTEAEAGIGSLLSALLEPECNPLCLRDGKLVSLKYGSDIIKKTFPEPFGHVSMLGVPTMDDVIFAEHKLLKSVRTYFYLRVDLPPGFFTFINTLKPMKNRWAYNLLEPTLRKQAIKEFNASKAKQNLTDGLFRISVIAPEKTLSAQAYLPPTPNGTSWLPVIICKKIEAGKLFVPGFYTSLDVVTPEEFFAQTPGIKWEVMEE